MSRSGDGKATHRRPGVRLRVLGRRGVRVMRRHYLSLGSIVVIGVLFALVMSSDSFVARKSRVAQPMGEGASVDAAPARPHRAVLFFVVQDQAQLTSISEAYMDDQEARAGGPYDFDHVVYLVAGTEQEEADAIARINFETLLIEGADVDLKVVDVRGRFGR